MSSSSDGRYLDAVDPDNPKCVDGSRLSAQQAVEDLPVGKVPTEGSANLSKEVPGNNDIKN